MKFYVENEPFWLNMEAFKAARVLIKEISAAYHQEDLDVTHWGHAFVYHASEINFQHHSNRSFPNISLLGDGCIYRHW